MELLEKLSGNLVDILIYAAILTVAVTGYTKCVLTSRRCARHLRRAVRQLEVMTIKDGSQPVWQDTLFLGRMLQTAWRRFLVNAEQLDSRGMNCDVEDYVNDDTVIYAHCHTQLGDVIPGILTSLGILGTFIGLMRGLGALDLSDAANTMSGISDMISGMNFAFGTSIAGCACSLLFNILNHAALGSTQKAIDEFHEAFTEFVMQQPLSDNVQVICQQEDRAAFLRHAVNELGNRMAEGMHAAVEHGMAPVTQTINQFLMGETQQQLEGLEHIVTSFVGQMNRALDGQFSQLGQTLSAINQAQRMDYGTLNAALDAAGTIMNRMQEMGDLMGQVAQRMEGYADELSAVQGDQSAFAGKTQELLDAMHTAVQEQSDYLLSLRAGHEALESSMQEYAQWSGRVLEAVHQQAEGQQAVSQQTAQAMRDSSHQLSESYTAFVENISAGLSRTMGLFEENMHGVVSLLDGKLESIERTARTAQSGYADRSARLNESTEGLLTALSRLQRALGDMTQCVETASGAMNGAKEA